SPRLRERAEQRELALHRVERDGRRGALRLVAGQLEAREVPGRAEPQPEQARPGLEVDWREQTRRGRRGRAGAMARGARRAGGGGGEGGGGGGRGGAWVEGGAGRSGG